MMNQSRYLLFKTMQSNFTRRVLLGVFALFLVASSQADLLAQIGSEQLAEIKRVYVPAEQLSALVNKGSIGGILTKSQFEELLRKEIEERANLEQTPNTAIIHSADYEVEVDADRLVGTMTASISVFGESWKECRFDVAGWSIESAMLDGQPAAVTRDGKMHNTLRVFITTPGKQELKLKISAPLQAQGGDKALSVKLPEPASGEFRITLPAGKFLESGSRDLDRPAAADQPATYTLPIGGQNSLNLRITDRQKSSKGDVLTFASTAIGLKVFPSEITWAAQTELQVFGREIDRLTCLIPNTLEITGIESKGLESWELADAPNDDSKTLITLLYRQGFDGRRTLQFRGILSEKTDSAWSVPTLVIPSVNSHTGAIVIQHPGNLRLQAVESVGVRTVNDANVTNVVAKSNGPEVYYQVWDEEFVLRFVASLKQQEVQAAMTNILDITETGLNLYSTISIETRLAPIFDFRLRLPSNWEIGTITVGETKSTWQTIEIDDSAQELRIPLNPPLSPGQTRNISLMARTKAAEWSIQDEPQRVTIPEVRLPQVDMLEALYGIAVADDFKVVTQQMTGLDPAGQQEISTLDQKLSPLGKKTRLAYTYQDTVFQGEIDISREPANLTAETLTFFRVDDSNLFTRLEAILNITGGGYRELNVLVSESAGEQLRFNLLPENSANQQQMPTTVRLVEQIPGEVTDGFRNWKLRFDRYLHGNYRITTEVRSERGSESSFRPAELQIPVSQIVSGYIAIEGASDEHVKIEAQDSKGSELRIVDPVDFPRAQYRPKERVIAGYRFIHTDWEVKVALNEFERAPVPTVVGHSASLASVLSQSGKFQHQANIEFVAIGAQSLIIKLPKDANLWATLLNGAPVEVRQSPEGMQIPITGLSTGRHQLQLSYSTEAPELDRMGELKTTPPSLTVIDGQGEQQPVEILTQDWELHLPNETLLIGSVGRFEPVGRLLASSIFTSLQNVFRLPTERSFVRRAWFLAWAGIALLIFWGLRRSALLDRLLTRIGRITAMIICGVLLLVVCFFFIIPLGLSSRPDSAARPTSYYSHDGLVYEEAPMDEMSSMEMGAEGSDESFGVAGNLQYREPPRPAAMPVETPPGETNDSFIVENSTNLEMNGDRQAPIAGEALARDMAANQKSSTRIGMPQAEFESHFDLPELQPQPNEPSNKDFGETTIPQSGPEQQQAQQIERFDSRLSGETIVQNRGEPAPNGRVRRSGRTMSTGGLLSMTFDLQIPAGTRTQKFHYQGNGLSAEDVDLQVRYANRTTGQVLIWSIALGIALLGWWLRRSQIGTKATWIGLTVLAPLSVAWLVPPIWQLLLEGILFGGIASTILWALGWCIACCRCCCGWLTKGACPAAIGLMALSIAFGPAGSAFAQPAPQVKHPPQRQPANFVIIPYESLDDIDSADRVWVPQEVYRQLWQNAHPEDFPALDGPITATISEANYSSTVELVGDGHQIVTKARWVISVLTDKPVGVTIPVTGAAISSVTLNGEDAALEHLDNGQDKVVIRGQGVHVVDAQLRSPCFVSGSVGEFSISLLPVASGVFNFELPKDAPSSRVRVDGLTRAYRRISTEGATTIQFPIDRGGKKTVNWYPESDQGAQNQLVQVETAIAARIDDGGIHVSHAFQTRVRQGAMNDLTFIVPAELSIREITGQDIGGWELNGTEDAKELKVFFRREINDQTDFYIHLYQQIEIGDAATQFEIPTIEPREISRETVQLALFAADHMKLRVAATSGLSQIDVSRYQPVVKPQQPNTAPRFAYRSSSRPLKLSVAVERLDAEAKTIVEHGIHIARRKQLVASRVIWQLTGAPRRRVSVAIPDDYLPISVVCQDATDWYVHEKDSEKILSIEFATPKVGRIEAGLEGHIPKQPDDESIELNLPKPLDADGQTVTLGVWLDSVYQASIAQVGKWNSLRPNQLSASYQKLDPQPVQFAFRTTAEDTANIVLSLQTAVPKLTTDIATLIAVSDATIDYGITLRWNISQAAADTFTFTTPSWLTNIDINGPAIREIQSQNIDDERKRWTVSLIDPVRERYLLSIAATVPTPLDQNIETPFIESELKVGDEAYQKIQVQQQYGILVNLSPNQLVPNDLEQFESVPLEQIPIVVHKELVQQAMEITRIRKGKSPSWKIQRMQEAAVAKAVILSAHLETVLELDGSWRTLATYGIRNRGRQFVALKLPEESRILSVFVRGKPSRTVVTQLNEEQIHMVALPQTSVADLSFDVSVMIAGRFDHSLKSEFALRGRDFSIPALDILSQQESEEFGLPVTQTLWTVHLPEEIDAKALTGVSSTNLTPHASDAWLAVERQTLERIRADVSEMARLATDKKVSKYRRQQAQDNLRRLNLSLAQSEDEYSTRDVKGGKADEIREQLFGENRFLQEQAEKAAKDSTPEYVETEELVGKAGRAYIALNNSILLDNNGGDIQLDALNKKSTTFNFLDTDADGVVEQKVEESKRKSVSKSSRSKLKSQIADQKFQLFDDQSVNINGTGVMQNDISGIVDFTQLPQQRGSSTTRELSTQFYSGASQPQSWQAISGGMVGGRGTGGEALGILLTDEMAPSNLSDGVNEEGRGQAETQMVPWSSAGGLSIEMNLPKNSKTLSFSKVGGNPALTLSVKPADAEHKIFGLVWCIVSLVAGLWILKKWRQTSSNQDGIRFLANSAIVTGLVGFFFLPTHLIWGFFWLFCLAGLVRVVCSKPAGPSIA